MNKVIQTLEELDAVLHWRKKHAIAIKERDALQLRLNAADQRIDELTTKPFDAERKRLMEIVEQYPNGDPLQYNAAVKEVSKMIGIERMPPMKYDEP
jgi:hypothetical protein